MKPSLKADFPLLWKSQLKNPFAYLDNAATTQKPWPVLDCLQNFYEQYTSNVHRGIYPLAEKATELYESARAKVAGDLGAVPQQVIFTGGATSALNLLATGLEDVVQTGDWIVLSELEHHANILPWQRLAKRTGAELHWIPVDENGDLDFEYFQEYFVHSSLKILSLSTHSHVLGNRIPVKEFFRLARTQGAFTFADATQSILHQSRLFADLECDALVFSGHKCLAPTGIGVLCARRSLQKKMQPLILGGGMVSEVNEHGAVWREMPWGFEGGTPPIEAAIALAEALSYRSAHIGSLVQSQMHVTTANIARFLRAYPQVQLYGWAQHPMETSESSILSFNVKGVHPHDVSQVFADHGVALRGGLHCAQILMKRLGCPYGTVRVSLAPYNDSSDEALFKTAFQNVLELGTEVQEEVYGSAP